MADFKIETAAIRRNSGNVSLRMNSKLKRFLKASLPPFWVNAAADAWRHITGEERRIIWKGNYSSWSAAMSQCTGYDSTEILQAVSKATREVMEGKKAYERDGVLFDSIEYSWPLLAGLMYAAARGGGSLRVLDFGGSLGSTFFQNRKFLEKLAQVSWNIIEQPQFVEVGNREFQTDILRFYTTVQELEQKTVPRVLLLSSVLQYLESPMSILDELLRSDKIDTVLLDRTPFSVSGNERICIQVVPPTIYPASIPCRILDWKALLEFLSIRGFSLLESFPGSFIDSSDNIVWRGGIWLR